jgi:hypothetical protein
MSKTSINQLPPDELELVPLQFFLMQEMPVQDFQIRTAVSDAYHSEEYVCDMFYKLISRCVGESSGGTDCE